MFVFYQRIVQGALPANLQFVTDTDVGHLIASAIRFFSLSDLPPADHLIRDDIIFQIPCQRHDFFRTAPNKGLFCYAYLHPPASVILHHYPSFTGVSRVEGVKWYFGLLKLKGKTWKGRGGLTKRLWFLFRCVYWWDIGHGVDIHKASHNFTGTSWKPGEDMVRVFELSLFMDLPRFCVFVRVLTSDWVLYEGHSSIIDTRSQHGNGRFNYEHKMQFF